MKIYTSFLKNKAIEFSESEFEKCNLDLKKQMHIFKKLNARISILKALRKNKKRICIVLELKKKIFRNQEEFKPNVIFDFL